MLDLVMDSRSHGFISTEFHTEIGLFTPGAPRPATAPAFGLGGSTEDAAEETPMALDDAAIALDCGSRRRCSRCSGTFPVEPGRQV